MSGDDGQGGVLCSERFGEDGVAEFGQAVSTQTGEGGVKSCF